MKKIFILLLVFLYNTSFAATPVNKDYLRNIQKALLKIHSASYYTNDITMVPYDKRHPQKYTSYYEEYAYPADTTIGAKVYSWNVKGDSLFFSSSYDGTLKALAYPEKKGIMINDFSGYDTPFRIYRTPFYRYARGIIEYVLQNEKDSIETTLTVDKDTVYMKFVIKEDQQIEFFGKAYKMPYPPQGIYIEPTSIYCMWIDRHTYLPFKIRREMSHVISETTVLRPVFNKLNIENFSLDKYFPKDAEIRKSWELKKDKKPNNYPMLNKRAPSWLLKDAYEKSYSLNDIKSKVILLNFTGIGCGACMASIPFMNHIENVYSKDELCIVSIETWKKNSQSLKAYAKHYNINYLFLKGNSSIIKEYSLDNAVPKFLILDSNYNIKYLYNGFSIEKSEKEIEDQIKFLLKKK